MGYRCPVCDDPQIDDKHLANHLAFTALVRGGEHEAWLDAEVPDWGQLGEQELATKLHGTVDEAAFPDVLEETTPVQVDDRGVHGRGESAKMHHRQPAPELDTEAQQAIERAKELTRQRRQTDEQRSGQSEQHQSGEETAQSDE